MVSQKTPARKTKEEKDKLDEILAELRQLREENRALRERLDKSEKDAAKWKELLQKGRETLKEKEPEMASPPPKRKMVSAERQRQETERTDRVEASWRQEMDRKFVEIMQNPAWLAELARCMKQLETVQVAGIQDGGQR